MTKSKKHLCILLMLLLCNISSCHFNFNKNVDGIVVTEDLWSEADDYGIDYCKLLKKALDGERGALRQFVNLEIFDADLWSQHYEVIVQIIRKKGERFFINQMLYCTHTEKERLLEMINFGIWYECDSEEVEENTKNEFPLIYEWLTSDETPDGT